MTKYFWIFLLTGIFNLLSAAEYPIGVYGVSRTDHYFKEMKEAGINIIHCYAANQKFDPVLLENAAKHQLKVMLYLNGVKQVKTPEGLEKAINRLKAVKKHPNLVMLLLADEPDEKLIDEMIMLNRLAKRTAPLLPTAIVENQNTGWWRYGKNRNSCDYLMLDQYPIGDHKFPDADMSRYSKFMTIGLKGPKPIMPVIQIFNWSVFPDMVKARKYNISKCRFPNRTELKFMIWSVVTRGPAGIFFYSLERCIQRDPKGKFLNNVFFPIVRELRQFSNEVINMSKVTASQTGDKDSFFAGYWHRGNREYLVIANNSKDKQTCRITLPYLGFSPWGNTRKTAEINHGSIRLEPWEIIIMSKGGLK